MHWPSLWKEAEGEISPSLEKPYRIAIGLAGSHRRIPLSLVRKLNQLLWNYKEIPYRIATGLEGPNHRIPLRTL